MLAARPLYLGLEPASGVTPRDLAALERAGSAARIDRRSLLERGLSRLPEPALRMAWHMKELYGVMKERFGHFQMARHYRVVEQVAKDAFRAAGNAPPPQVPLWQ